MHQGEAKIGLERLLTKPQTSQPLLNRAQPRHRSPETLGAAPIEGLHHRPVALGEGQQRVLGGLWALAVAGRQQKIRGQLTKLSGKGDQPRAHAFTVCR